MISVLETCRKRELRASKGMRREGNKELKVLLFGSQVLKGFIYVFLLNLHNALVRE